MITEFIDSIGSKATAIAVIYPIAVALYAVGFFWGIPSDIIGLFDIGGFLFKASIVYLTAISFLIILFSLAGIIYSPVLATEGGSGPKAGNPDGNEDTIPWSEFSKRRKIFWIFYALIMTGMIAWGISVDAPSLENELDGLVLFLGLLFFGSIILRPFISPQAWSVGKVLFFASVAFLIPILVGNSDAKPKEGSPVLVSGKERCPIIYVTSEVTVADCGSNIAVSLDGVEELLVWEKDR